MIRDPRGRREVSHSSAFIWSGLENAKRIYKQMKEIQEKARQEGIPVSLYQGCEIYTRPGYMENIRILKKMGCLVQVNLFNLKQEPNDEIRGCAQELLRAELIDMVGSDAHRMNHRKPELEQGAQYILEHCRTEYAEAVLWRNAETYILQPHILQPQRSGNHILQPQRSGNQP